MSEPGRRFYKEARAVEGGDGFSVALDGRVLRTPAGNPFALPTRALAEACAAEWEAQSDRVNPLTMPLTRLANVAIDRTPSARQEMIETIAKHGETDLLCHRADRPPSLVERQRAAWDPLVAWSCKKLDFAPAVVVGVTSVQNDIAPLASAARALDDFRLTALAHAVGLAGSAIIGFALLYGRLDGAGAFSASMLDDLFQIETWGEDGEARARIELHRAEFTTIGQFLTALRQP
jgi:chaperone required for assembly of F1-ATPase